MTASPEPPGVDGPLRHIARSSLPWRDAGLTECGRPLDDVARVVTYDEAWRQARELGRARFAFAYCTTCTDCAAPPPRRSPRPARRRT